MNYDYDDIVTDATLREMFGYDIPEGKVKLKRRQRKKKAKVVGHSQLPISGAYPAKKASRKRFGRKGKSRS